MWRAERRGPGSQFHRDLSALSLSSLLWYTLFGRFRGWASCFCPVAFSMPARKRESQNANWGQRNGGQPMCNRAFLAVRLDTPGTGRSFPPPAATRVLKSPASGPAELLARQAADRKGARCSRRRYIGHRGGQFSAAVRRCRRSRRGDIETVETSPGDG